MGHGEVLVGGALEVAAETAAGAEVIKGIPGYDFGGEVHSGTDRGDVRAGGGEFGEEGGGLLAVVGVASSGTSVSTRDQDFYFTW